MRNRNKIKRAIKLRGKVKANRNRRLILKNKGKR